MRKAVAFAIITVCIATQLPDARAQTTSAPVIFVHGMGGEAAKIGTVEFADLLQGIAGRHPNDDACGPSFQTGRPWRGSPCVFRYVDDKSGTQGQHDSQSPVQANADKLAREVAEVVRRTGRTAILIGYSMGGAIIRTYLATHEKDAERDVRAVIVMDGVMSGSWGYAFANELPHRVGALGSRLTELMRTMAATAASVDFTRPATHDLRPRSELFRKIAPMPLPRRVNYYTYWGDITVNIGRGLLTYDLPRFKLSSLGDLGLLVGDPDPTKLPELGGQRFSPSVDPGFVARDIAHVGRIDLDPGLVRQLIDVCGHNQATKTRSCGQLASSFHVPDVHTAVPTQLANIHVGDTTLLDAVLQDVSDNA